MARSDRKVRVATNRFPWNGFQRAELELTVVEGKVAAMKWLQIPIPPEYATGCDAFLDALDRIFILTGSVSYPNNLYVEGATIREVYALIYSTPLSIIGEPKIHLVQNGTLKILGECQTFGDVCSILGIHEQDVNGWTWYRYPVAYYQLALRDKTDVIKRMGRPPVRTIAMYYY